VFDGRDHNETLREQLEAERQAHAEIRCLLAALERMPAIEPPEEAPPGRRGSSETDAAPLGHPTTPGDAHEATVRPEGQESNRPCSLWSRLFGR
jgi:hypothetical protein